jgi:hypothetical protein
MRRGCAELIAGEILLVMQDQGLRNEAGFQTEAGMNQKSLAELGIKYWARAARWQAGKPCAPDEGSTGAHGIIGASSAA